MALAILGTGSAAQPSAGPHNYAAEHNARFEGLPLEQRAWPLYAELQAVLLPHARPLRNLQSASPDDLSWGDAKMLVLNMPGLVELAEEVQRRPELGWAWSDALPAEWVRATRGPEAPVPEPSENPALTSVALPYVTTISAAASCLRIEALRRAELGDPDGAVGVLELLPAMAEHLAETRTSITALMLVGTQAGSMVEGVKQLLTHHGDALTEGHLDRLDVLLDSVLGARFDTEMIADEALLFRDTMERTYDALDEEGEPAISHEGALLLLRLSSQPTPRGLMPDADEETRMQTLHDLRRQIISRAEAEAGWAEAMAAAAEDARRPIWEREGRPAAGVLRAQTEAAEEAGKAQPHILFLRGLGRLSEACEVLRMERDGARVAIALERHRRLEGRYPETLDALTPALLDEVPRDWIDGEPVRYRLDPERGPLVYSLGPDGDDDGAEALAEDLAQRYLYAPRRAIAIEQGLSMPDGDWVLWP